MTYDNSIIPSYNKYEGVVYSIHINNICVSTGGCYTELFKHNESNFNLWINCFGVNIDSFIISCYNYNQI